MIRHRSLSLALSAALVSSLMASAAAQAVPPGVPDQSKPSSSGSIPTFRTHANLVIVDVVVRDKADPVRGLHASDFHLFEDGRDQKISLFEEHSTHDALRVAQTPENLPPNTYSNTPRYALTSAANVLVLDALNTPLSDQVYIRRRMLAYLHTIPPGTRIAVFTLGSHLRIIAGFTTDAVAIEKALSGRGNPEKSPVMDPKSDQALSEVSNLAGDTGGINQQAMLQFAQENQVFEAQLRGDMTLDALQQLARYLTTIPGRKNVVWFTGSMPFSLVTGGSPNLDQMADLQDQAKKTMELLTLARAALYPVDARGLFGVPSSNPETEVMNPNLFNSVQAQATGGETQLNPTNAQSSGVASAGIPGESVRQVLQENDRVFIEQTNWDHLNMEAFARETGGKAFLNSNALGKALPEAIANGSDYYTLGYVPENNDYNGAYRKINVKLTEGRYNLEFRHGYYAVDPAKTDRLFTGARNPLVDAMQHGGLPLSELLFQVRAVPASDPTVLSKPAGALAGSLKGPLTRYVLDYNLDPREFTSKSLPNGQTERQVEVTQVVYSVDGLRLNYTDGAYGVDRSPAAEMQLIPMHQEIDLPAGPVYLRIGVRDMISGRIGTVEIPLQVEKTQVAAR